MLFVLKIYMKFHNLINILLFCTLFILLILNLRKGSFLPNIDDSSVNTVSTTKVTVCTGSVSSTCNHSGLEGLQKAITDAVENTVIEIAEGTYKGSHTLGLCAIFVDSKKNLTINGIGNVVLDGELVVGRNGFCVKNSENIVVSNIKIIKHQLGVHLLYERTDAKGIMTLKNIEISDNNKGGIVTNGNGVINMDTLNVFNNKEWGGVVFNNSKVTINNSKFNKNGQWIANTAGVYSSTGGGLAIRTSAEVNINESEFNENNAEGISYGNDSKGKVTKSKTNQNRAHGFLNDSTLPVTIETLESKTNGAEGIQSSSTGGINIDGANIEGNRHGIYISGGIQTALSIKNLKLLNNKKRGGEFSQTSNKIITLENIEVKNNGTANESDNKQGIVIQEGARLSIKNLKLIDHKDAVGLLINVNHTDEINVMDSIFTGNMYGVVITNVSKVKLENIQTNDNVTDGISIQGKSDVRILGTKNESSNNGGSGIIIFSDDNQVSKLNIDNFLLKNNKAFGIRSAKSANIVLKNIKAESNKQNISVTQKTVATISDTTTTGGEYGLAIRGSVDATISKFTASNASIHGFTILNDIDTLELKLKLTDSIAHSNNNVGFDIGKLTKGELKNNKSFLNDVGYLLAENASVLTSGNLYALNRENVRIATTVKEATTAGFAESNVIVTNLCKGKQVFDLNFQTGGKMLNACLGNTFNINNQLTIQDDQYVGDFITLPADKTLAIDVPSVASNNMTISFWVRIPSTESTKNAVIFKVGPEDSLFSLNAVSNSLNKINVKGSYGTLKFESFFFQPGVWNHFLIQVENGTSVKSLVNGINVGEFTATKTVSNLNKFTFGSGVSFDITNIKGFNSTLTTDEINNIIKLYRKVDEPFVKCGSVNSDTDKIVGFEDFVRFSSLWQKNCIDYYSDSVTYCKPIDSNRNFIVDFPDFLAFAQVWKKNGCN